MVYTNNENHLCPAPIFYDIPSPYSKGYGLFCKQIPLIFKPPPLKNFRGRTGYHLIRGHVIDDRGPRPHHGTVSDRNAWTDKRVRRDPNLLPDHDGRFEQRETPRRIIVCAGADVGVLADRRVCGPMVILPSE